MIYDKATENDRFPRTAAPRFGFERKGSSDSGFAASASLRRRSVSLSGLGGPAMV